MLHDDPTRLLRLLLCLTFVFKNVHFIVKKFLQNSFKNTSSSSKTPSSKVSCRSFRPAHSGQSPSLCRALIRALCPFCNCSSCAATTVKNYFSQSIGICLKTIIMMQSHFLVMCIEQTIQTKPYREEKGVFSKMHFNTFLQNMHQSTLTSVSFNTTAPMH